MKKIVSTLLAALFILCAFAGCGGDKPAAPEASPEASPDAAPVSSEAAAPAGPFSPEGSVIFEKDGVKVTTAGLDYDPTSGNDDTIIWVDIENASSKEVCLGVDNGAINGFMGSVLLMDFQMEDGEYYGADSNTTLVLPAESSGRYALGYYKQGDPKLDLDTLAELEFCFTFAEDESSWPNYYSEPVVIKTGETVAPVDITKLGETVIDNDELLLVIGDQDYDEWFGPYIYIYTLNKTDKYIGLTSDAAEVDGIVCDYMYYGDAIAPGKRSDCTLSFDGDARELKGFEKLTLNLSYTTADTRDALDPNALTALDPISVSYPPQLWGTYSNGGIKLEIKPKINELVAVEVPENDAQGLLFSVTEKASREAADYDGAGWLFSIAKISEAELHERLCRDMTGQEVFAKDAEGNYYIYYHPTDVRYFRATTEEMMRDQDQWTMLCRWAEDMRYSLLDSNGLEYVSYDDSEVSMLVARAAWGEGVNATLSTTEYGPVPIAGVDGEKYADFVLQGYFEYAGPDVETPDGEYIVLNFPEDNVRVDFFRGEPSVARIVSSDTETLYQAVWTDDNISYADAMLGWYYAACEKAGVKEEDTSLDKFLGDWHEQIAGRGMISVEKSVAPGAAKIYARWPDSAAVIYEWELVAFLDEDGSLRYENGHMTVTEYDENGDSWINDESYEENGYFYIGSAGELIWHDDTVEDSMNNEDVFVH